MIEDKDRGLPAHPMQPLLVDGKGVVRFRKNNIVEFLLDSGHFDLNQIIRMDFSREDYEQLMMLIGYSTSGFGELSTSCPERVALADDEAEEMLKNHNAHPVVACKTGSNCTECGKFIELPFPALCDECGLDA